MGNTNAENKRLKIYIETEKQFYNCGSSIEGVVFVEAADNFKFDALYLRIEGKTNVIQELSGASGSKAARQIVLNMQETILFTLWNTSYKNTMTKSLKKGNTLILFP